MEKTPYLSSSSVTARARREAGKTTSTCTTETIQGSHLFHICGFRATKGLGFGTWITSGTFNVGGYDWSIRYYPDGEQRECEGYISLFVELMSKNVEVRTFYDLRLVDQNTQLSCSVFRTAEAPTVFKAQPPTPFKVDFDAPIRGHRQFMRRNELEASAYVRDDRLTIECVIEVVRDRPRVSDTTTLSGFEVPLSDITEQLGKLLEEEELADVAFSVGGESFAAHKMMLAVRSPVFKAELCGPMREKDTQCITIDDMQPEVFRALLHFIYTDSLPTTINDLCSTDSKEIIKHLLAAADRYDVERLKLVCGHILSKSLDVETVATTLTLADQHNCEKLKEACVEFMTPRSRMDDVMALPGYQDLKRSSPSLLVDLWEKRGRIDDTSRDAVEASQEGWISMLARFFRP